VANDLMNGEDLIGSNASSQSTGRFSAYQWAWFYVIASLAGLVAMGFLVLNNR
jgi:hypothetical protein